MLAVSASETGLLLLYAKKMCDSGIHSERLTTARTDIDVSPLSLSISTKCENICVFWRQMNNDRQPSIPAPSRGYFQCEPIGQVNLLLRSSATEKSVWEFEFRLRFVFLSSLPLFFPVADDAAAAAAPQLTSQIE